jgi:hypothetical protein
MIQVIGFCPAIKGAFNKTVQLIKAISKGSFKKI